MSTIFLSISTDDLRALIEEAVHAAPEKNAANVLNNETLLNAQEAAAMLCIAVNTLYEKASESLSPSPRQVLLV